MGSYIWSKIRRQANLWIRINRYVYMGKSFISWLVKVDISWHNKKTSSLVKYTIGYGF